MKKTFIIVTLSLLLTACGKQDRSSSVPTDISGGEGADIGADKEPIVKHDNPRVDYTVDEAREIIERSSNLKVSDDYFYVSAPKTIDHISEFIYGTSYQLPPEEELEEFKRVFKYLFPAHEFDENCLYAFAVMKDVDPEEQDIFKTRFHSLKNDDNLSAYLNGTLGDPDSMRHLMYTEEQFPREESVSLFFRSPFGNDYCVFNKGVCNKLTANLNGNVNYYAYEQFRLDDEDFGFEFVGSYPPDSKDTYMLLDKEISIKNAVAFFENYIASIPVSDESVFRIHVNNVDVYRLDEEHYGFEFTNSRIYDGIHFNGIWDGCSIDGLNRDMSYGVMVQSSDIDHVYATFNAFKAYDEVQHTQFVSFEDAVITISEKMTDYVGFEVTRAELIYRYKSNVGVGSGVGETLYPVYPSWKLTMFNPNDNLKYVAYVNALTGEFEGGR